jgi:hypothetical protein
MRFSAGTGANGRSIGANRSFRTIQELDWVDLKNFGELFEHIETMVERIVIMPATVGRWRKNLQPFSALRSFEQAQCRNSRPN